MSTESIKTEVQQAKDLLHAKVDEVFEKTAHNYLKTPYATWQAEGWPDFSLSVNEPRWYNSPPKVAYCTMELVAKSYSNTIRNDGLVGKFVTRTREFKMNVPIEELYSEIEKFISQFPAYAIGIAEAQRIEAEKRARKEEAGHLKAAALERISEVTGYPLIYGAVSVLKTPYAELTGFAGHARATVNVPLDKFAEFNAFVTGLLTE